MEGLWWWYFLITVIIITEMQNFGKNKICFSCKSNQNLDNIIKARKHKSFTLPSLFNPSHLLKEQSWQHRCTPKLGNKVRQQIKAEKLRQQICVKYISHLLAALIVALLCRPAAPPWMLSPHVTSCRCPKTPLACSSHWGERKAAGRVSKILCHRCCLHWGASAVAFCLTSSTVVCFAIAPPSPTSLGPLQFQNETRLGWVWSGSLILRWSIFWFNSARFETRCLPPRSYLGEASDSWLLTRD